MLNAPWDLMMAMYRESLAVGAGESLSRAQEAGAPHMKETDRKRFFNRLKSLVLGRRHREDRLRGARPDIGIGGGRYVPGKGLAADRMSISTAGDTDAS